MNKKVMITAGVIAVLLLAVLAFTVVLRYNNAMSDVDTLETSFSEKSPKPPSDNMNEKPRPEEGSQSDLPKSIDD